ncbi:hypothetical protein GCM10007105_25330 [Shewanella chilikensis]|nr:hypothetical protein GCM10007105_25330 [Shewanella chilikensis]
MHIKRYKKFFLSALGSLLSRIDIGTQAPQTPIIAALFNCGGGGEAWLYLAVSLTGGTGIDPDPRLVAGFD